MLGRDQAGINAEAPALDREIVIAATELDAAHLHHVEAPPLSAKAVERLFERDHSVCDAVQLEIAILGGLVVEHQHGAAPSGEILLQGKDLPAVAKRALGEEAQLGQAVQHHPARLQFVHLAHDAADGFPKLDLAGVQQGLLLVFPEAGFEDHLEQFELLERPAVRGRHRIQLGLSLGQGNVEPALALARSRQEETEPKRGLARSWGALDEVHAIGG